MAEKEEGMIIGRPAPIGERLQEVMHKYYLNMNSLSVRLHLPSNSAIVP